MTAIKACPYCGVVASPEVMRGHTRQECEAKIRERIQHHESAAQVERDALTALHEAANRDAGVPA